MLLKIISAVLLAVTLSTTSALAKNTEQLTALAGKQQVLSAQITEAYRKHDKSVNMMTTIKALEAGQNKLKKYAIHNSEIDNLFVFLTICLTEMKVLVKKPFSAENAQLVADLGASISEGSHYIAKA
jgi:hypothetical protein